MASPDEMIEFTKFAHRLADAAGEHTLPLFRQGADVFNKAGIWFDPVTDADREAERAQRRLIGGMYPGHGIVGEEFGSENADAQYRWVLDPIDGTRAYVCGVPSWTTLIALEENGRPLLGLIDQPFTGERWSASQGVLTYTQQGQQIDARTHGCTDLSKARLTTTDPRRSAYFSKDESEAFDAVSEKAQLVRYSLDAYGYALLALGQFDLVIESGLAHHDFAALAPVVEAAGGVITNWRGDAPGTDDRGRILAASTPALHAAALEYLAPVQ